MKKRTIPLLLVVLILSLACQTLFPAPRDGTVMSKCADTVKAVYSVQPGGVPQDLEATGIKTGGEFDANEYFKALTHLSMQNGYSLDYVYQVDGLGAYPILYALPSDQAPYTSIADIPEGVELTDYRDHLAVEDVEQGYFEYVAMSVLASQFYLVWHAYYNDLQIVCDKAAADQIVADINSSEFGMELDLKQRTQVGAMQNVEPLVELTHNTAIVDVVLFTKWGGFYRRTYTIDRAFPHTIIDVKEENLVPYDCGIMF
jgi:hypothetical protein